MGNEWIDTKLAVQENRGVQLTDWFTVTYQNGSTNKKRMLTLPAGAVVLDVLVQVTTAFDATTTNTLSVGSSGTANLFMDALDVSATGMKDELLNTTPVCPAARLTAATVVYATYAQSGTAATAGSARVAIVWAPWSQSPDD